MQFWEITLLIAAQTLLSLVLFASAIALLVFLLRRPMRRYKPIDLAIFGHIEPWIHPLKNKIMLFITFLGKHQFLIPANLVLIFYFIAEKKTWFSIRVLTIALSSLVLMLLLKSLFQRKRPLSPLLKAARGLSFPSGHAIMAVTFYGLLFYILMHSTVSAWLRYLLGSLLVVLIFLIGYSRVYLRVHYASDVLAGFIVGLLWLLISLFVLDRLELYTKSPPIAVAKIIINECPRLINSGSKIPVKGTHAFADRIGFTEPGIVSRRYLFNPENIDGN